MPQQWETSPRRAWNDTKNWVTGTTFRAVLIGYIILAVLTPMLTAYLTPTATTRLMNGIYGFIGATIAFLLLLFGVYLYHVIVTPYRQRNEARAQLAQKPKPKPLSNRDELLRVLSEAEMATIEFVISIEFLKGWGKLHPNELDGKVTKIFEDAEHRQRNSYQALEKEILVAGKDYEPILKPLYVFMQSSAILNASPEQNKDILTYKAKLEELIIETRNKIDELNPLTSHKGDSQN